MNKQIIYYLIRLKNLKIDVKTLIQSNLNLDLKKVLHSDDLHTKTLVLSFLQLKLNNLSKSNN